MFLVFFIHSLRKRTHFLSFNRCSLSVIKSLTVYSWIVIFIHLHILVPKGALGISNLIWNEFQNRAYLILMPLDILWRVSSGGKKTFSKLPNTSKKWNPVDKYFGWMPLAKTSACKFYWSFMGNKKQFH